MKRLYIDFDGVVMDTIPTLYKACEEKTPSRSLFRASPSARSARARPDAKADRTEGRLCPDENCKSGERIVPRFSIPLESIENTTASADG